jgi:hypothetical protein
MGSMEKITFEITREDINTRAGRNITDEEWGEVSGIVSEELRFLAWDIIDDYLDS